MIPLNNERFSSTKSSFFSGFPKQTAIENEMKILEKTKSKQKTEIKALLEHEINLIIDIIEKEEKSGYNLTLINSLKKSKIFYLKISYFF